MLELINLGLDRINDSRARWDSRVIYVVIIVVIVVIFVVDVVVRELIVCKAMISVYSGSFRVIGFGLE